MPEVLQLVILHHNYSQSQYRKKQNITQKKKRKRIRTLAIKKLHIIHLTVHWIIFFLVNMVHWMIELTWGLQPNDRTIWLVMCTNIQSKAPSPHCHYFMLSFPPTEVGKMSYTHFLGHSHVLVGDIIFFLNF